MTTPSQISPQVSAARHQQLSAWEGALAVYREGAMLALVQLQSVEVKTEGVGAELVLVRRLACEHKGCYVRKRWKIYAVWEYFNGERDSWASSIVGWHLVFDRALIAGLLDFCATLPARQAAEERWEKVDEFIANFERQPQPEPTLDHQHYAEEIKAGWVRRSGRRKRAVIRRPDN